MQARAQPTNSPLPAAIMDTIPARHHQHDDGPTPAVTTRTTPSPMPTDYLALSMLYATTAGKRGWYIKTNWLTNEPCTSDAWWYGVSCNGEDRVSGLHFTRNRLYNELPTQLGLLSEMTVFAVVGEAAIDGTLPTELGGFVRAWSRALCAHLKPMTPRTDCMSSRFEGLHE